MKNHKINHDKYLSMSVSTMPFLTGFDLSTKDDFFYKIPNKTFH